MQKQKRIVDEELLATVRNLCCMACVSINPEGAREAVFENQVRSHPHHLISKGSGGNDVAENLMSLCFAHHSLVHNMGLRAFSIKFTAVKHWLTEAGWKFNGLEWEEPTGVRNREVPHGE